MKALRVFVAEIVAVADRMGNAIANIKRRISRLVVRSTEGVRSAIIAWLREANLLMGPPVALKYERILNQ